MEEGQKAIPRGRGSNLGDPDLGIQVRRPISSIAGLLALILSVGCSSMSVDEAQVGINACREYLDSSYSESLLRACYQSLIGPLLDDAGPLKVGPRDADQFYDPPARTVQRGSCVFRDARGFFESTEYFYSKSRISRFGISADALPMLTVDIERIKPQAPPEMHSAVDELRSASIVKYARWAVRKESTRGINLKSFQMLCGL